MTFTHCDPAWVEKMIANFEADWDAWQGDADDRKTYAALRASLARKQAA